MKKESGAYKHIALIIIVLSFSALACGLLTAEDETLEEAVVSEQDEVQAPVDSSTSDEDQELQEDQVEELPSREASDQAITDEEKETTEGDESPTDTDVGSGGIEASALEDISAMQVVMVVENLDSGETMEVSYSFIRPDRFLTNLVGLETLTIGDTAYLKDPEGQFVEQALLPADVIKLAVEEVTAAFTERATIYELLEDPSDSGLTLVGEETINSIETVVYSYDGGITSPLTGIINGEVKVWVGKSNGLIYRQEVLNSSNTGLGPRSRGIVEIVYGDAVIIEGPN